MMTDRNDGRNTNRDCKEAVHLYYPLAWNATIEGVAV